MTKPSTRYGILDDFGEVIRWQWDKPSANYRYIIDWDNFEPAPY